MLINTGTIRTPDEERCPFIRGLEGGDDTHLSRRYLMASFGNVETFRVNLPPGASQQEARFSLFPPPQS